MLLFSLSSSGAVGVSKLPLIVGLALEGRQSRKRGGGLEGSGSLLHPAPAPCRMHTHTHPWMRIHLSINHLAEDAVLFGLGPLLGPPSFLRLCCPSGCETQREKQVSKSSLAFPTSQMGLHTPWTGLQGLLGTPASLWLGGQTPRQISSKAVHLRGCLAVCSLMGLLERENTPTVRTSCLFSLGSPGG